MCNYISIHRLWRMVSLDGQGLGRNMIGKLVTWKSGRGINLSEWIKWRYVSYVNVHQWVNSAEEDFHKVDRMTHSVDTSFFPQTPCHHPVGSWTKWSWCQWWSLCMGSTPRLCLVIAIADCLICQQQRPTVSPQYGTIPCGRLITLDCFHHGKGSILFSVE